MATYHVYDGGDDSDGSTWAKAFQSITNATVLAAAAGSEIRVASDHTDQDNASKSIVFSNGTYAAPIVVVSLDRTDDSYQNMTDGGGTIETTGAADDINIGGEIRVFGLKFDAGDRMEMTAGDKIYFSDCDFISVDNIRLNENAHCRYDGCRINTSDTWLTANYSHGVFRNCTWAGASTNGFFQFGSSINKASIVVEDSDLSTEADLAYELQGNMISLTIRRCELASGWLATLVDDIDKPESFILVESSVDGAQSDPIIGMQLYRDYWGSITPETTLVRTGGASDGTTTYSWKMETTANADEYYSPLRSPPVVQWVSGGSSITVKVYIYHDGVGSGGAGDLQDDEFWIELSGPDDSDYAQGYYTTSLPATIKTTPSDLTNDGSSTWGGALATKQEVSVSYTPQDDGPVSVRFCLGKPSVTMYVDPKLDIS